MSDGDGGVVAFEKRTEGLVNKGFRLGVKGGRCCIQSIRWRSDDRGQLDIPSSRIKMSGFLTRALAIAIRCF